MLFFKFKEHQLVSKIPETFNELQGNRHLLWAILAVLLLMPVNWLLEAVKWKLLIRPIQSITLGQSFKGILRGVCLGFITPHAIGDYLGRVMAFSNVKKWESIGAVFMSRSVQMSVTLFFGLFAVVGWLSAAYIFQIFQITIVLLLLGAVFVFLSMHLNRSLKKKIQTGFKVIKSYSPKVILKVIAAALLRYFVFSTQYVVLLTILQVDLPFTTLLNGIFWVFFAKSVLPTFNFASDLGVRELSAILYFERWPNYLDGIVLAGLLLWCINIVLPTLIGTFLLFRSKVRIK